jgi:predicted metal-dependent peptidase
MTSSTAPDISGVEDKLLQARSRLIHRNPWYGTFVASMDWKASDMNWLPPNRRTMGVYMKQGGKIGCIYNVAWCAKFTLRQLYGIIQHEIEHIVRLHPVRCGSRNPDGWNIAADMCCNGKRSKVRIGYPEGKALIFPTEDAIFIPEKWDENKTAEEFYATLEKNSKTSHCNQCGRTKKTYKLGDNDGDKDGNGGKGKDGKDKGDGQGGGKGKPGNQPGQGKGQGQGQGQGQDPGDGEGSGEGDGQDQCGDGDGSGTPHKCSGCGEELDGKSRYGGVEGETLDNHDIWKQSDASEDDARQYVQELARRATEKNRGKAPAHLKDAIEALEKPVVRWRELLRIYLGKHCGNRRHTWARRNRRFRGFGIKGDSHHAAAEATVIVDTSGSISKEELQRFFGEIESIMSRTNVVLVQCDAAVHHCAKYRRGDWRKIEIKGRGGTDMPVAFKHIEDNGLVSDVVILLTDGFTPWPEDHGYPVIFVITQNFDEKSGPQFGHIVRLDKK